MGINLECSSCPRLAGLLNSDNDPGRYADGGNQACYNSGSAGHCSLSWSESQGQAPAQSRGFSSAGLFFRFKGNLHPLMALVFLLPSAWHKWRIWRFLPRGSTAQIPSLNLIAGLEALEKSHRGLVQLPRVSYALVCSPFVCPQTEGTTPGSNPISCLLFLSRLWWTPPGDWRVACLTSLALTAQPCRDGVESCSVGLRDGRQASQGPALQ